MQIQIYSREKVEEISANPFSTKTALISITDYDWSYAKLRHKPDYILQLAFDDIDNDVFEDELGRQPTEEERVQIENKYHMFSDEQAEQILDFYKKIRDKVDCLICQCEHGQSRSAAVASAIMEYEYGKGIEIFADDRYYPNKLVFRKVLKELNRL